MINIVGEESYSTEVSILNRIGANLRIDNGAITIGDPKPVSGNPNFETYKISNVTGNLTIKSNQAIQISVIGGQL